MSTEILGFFIILGALVLVVLRRNEWLHLLSGEKHTGHMGDVEDASAKLRYELQHSADEIIARMGDHMDHLERLVAEADRRSAVLENQLRRMESMQRGSTRIFPTEDWDASREGNTFSTRNNPEASELPLPFHAEISERYMGSEELQPFEDVLEASMTVSENTNDYARRAFETRLEYEVDPDVVVSPSVADVAGLPLTPEEAAEIESATVAESESDSEFESGQGAVSFAEDLSPEILHEEEQADRERQAVAEALRLHGGGASERVRSLLGQGKSVDDIAREVQLGRGAIELIQQMEKSKEVGEHV